MSFRKWKPSRSKINEFKDTMKEIEDFCYKNNIQSSKNNDSYYFTLNGVNYRVSNHSIEASNNKAYNEYGVQVREKYHGSKREENTIYIHASKTRIIEIYNNLKLGYALDGRGNIKR